MAHGVGDLKDALLAHERLNLVAFLMANSSPVFLYSDSRTLPKCPRPSTATGRKFSMEMSAGSAWSMMGAEPRGGAATVALPGGRIDAGLGGMGGGTGRGEARQGAGG